MNVQMTEQSVDSQRTADKRVVNALTHLRIRLIVRQISRGDNGEVGLLDVVGGAALLLARELIEVEVELTLGPRFNSIRRSRKC
jgi:hypothetical protein